MPNSQLLLSLSLKISRLLVQECTIDQLLIDCCKAITDSGQFNTAWIGLLSDDQTYFDTMQYAQYAHSTCIKETLPSFVLSKSLKLPDIIHHCIFENQPIIINKLQKKTSLFKPWQTYYKTSEVKSIIALAIRLHPSLSSSGCMMITSKRENEFTEEVIDLLKSIALTISQFIAFKRECINREKKGLLNKESEIRFRKLLDYLPNIAIQGYDKNRCIIYWNLASEKLYGYSKKEVMGKKLDELIIPENMKQDVIDAIKHWYENGIVIPASELHLTNKKGEDVPVYSNHVMLNIPDGDLEMFCIDIDLSEQKEAQIKLEYKANYDQLTQLPNRNLFIDRFEQVMSEAKRFNKIIAVIFMDLDNFKYINDTFGHKIGDLLLIQVAKRLNCSLRKYDLVSRFGGDEFVIALPYLDHEKLIVSLVKKIRAAFEQPFELEGQSSHITCSMGISFYPESGDDINKLLKFADMAMYKAKESGRNQFHFFNEKINNKVNRQIELSTILEQALKNNELRLLYQPQVELATGEIVSCEVSIRWYSKKLGEVLPDEFIPVAEQSNLINKIEFWVMNKINADLKSWQNAGKQPVRVFANFSERGFSDNQHLLKLKYFINEHCSITRYLGIQLSESVLLKASEQSNQLLSLLHKNGISLCLDKFGSGYSSINYLKNSPIDRVKINKELLYKATIDGREEPFINAIIAMARELNIITIAVGVEESRQKKYIEQTQCELVQGLIYHKPMDAEQFKNYLSPARI